MRPKTLLEIARRNDYALPTDTEEGVSKLYDYRVLGASPQAAYEAGVTGALCDDDARDRLRGIGEEHDWRPLP